MRFLFLLAILAVLILAYKPLKEASAYRFRHRNLLLEGLVYIGLALAGLLTGSWWPLIAAGVLAVVLYQRRSR